MTEGFPRPVYLADMVPNDFYLIPNLKSTYSGRRQSSNTGLVYAEKNFADYIRDDPPTVLQMFQHRR